jgi:Ca2+-binding EF-hand superfamily protein
MVSKYGQDFQIPKDFPSVVKAFTREVLRSQPENIYEFGEQYFQNLLNQSQSANADSGTERLTPEQMEAKLIALFHEADTDGSGALSLQEFKVLLKRADLGLDTTEVMRLMAEADVNSDGQIDYSEFVPLAVELVQGITAKKEAQEVAKQQEVRAREAANEYMLHGMSKDALSQVILDVFKKADKDNSGSLTIAEFQMCIREADLGLTRKEVNVLMHSVDVDFSGEITYEEFAPLCFDILVEILKDELMAAQKTTSEMEDFLRLQFQGADPSGAGKLKTHELRDALAAADLGLTRLQILTVVSEAEVEDELGNVDYAKFAGKAATLVHFILDPDAQRERKEAVERILGERSDEEVEQALLAACSAADTERTGMLPYAALKQALEGCGLELAPKEVQALLGAGAPRVVDDNIEPHIEYGPLIGNANQILQYLKL